MMFCRRMISGASLTLLTISGLCLTALAESVNSTWTCLSENWVATACWDNVAPGDLYPDDANGNVYAVTLPAASYTLEVNDGSDTDIGVDTLVMEGTSTTLEVGPSNLLRIQSELVSRGALLIWGQLTADAGATIDVNQSDVYAYDFGFIDLPVTSYAGSSDCLSEFIQAKDSSAIILDDLVTVDGSSCGGVGIYALSGGLVDLSGLTSSINSVTYKAEGEGSLLLMSQMDVLSDATMFVTDGGRVLAAPITTFDNVGLVVSGPDSVLDLSAVTSMNESDVTASLGAMVSLPLVTSITGSSSCLSEFLTATGSGSMLDLSSVTSIDGSTCGGIAAEAALGGVVDLSGLVSSTNDVTYKANGAGSVLYIDQIASLNDGWVTVLDGGSIVAAPLTSLEGVYITVDNAASSLDLSQVTTIDGSSLIAQDGAVLTLPQVHQIIGSSSCLSETLKASGAGTVLDLSTITTLDGSLCGSVVVTAEGGGLIDLSALPVSTNNVSYQATGAESELRIDLLDYLDAGALTVTGGGTVVAAPFTSLEDIILTVGGPTSVLDLSQVASIAGSDITVKEGANVALPLITGIAGSSSCLYEILKATGVDSILDLTAVTALDGSSCGDVVITAEAGGWVDLSFLPVSQNGVSYVSSGAGSVLRIDLIDQLYAGSVTVTGGGTLVAAPLAILNDMSLTIGGPTSSIDLSQVISLDRDNVTIQDGAYAAFPMLTSYSRNNDCGFKTLKATGAGSVLDLSSITSMNGQSCGATILEASSDGAIDLTSLALGIGNIVITVSGDGSALYGGGFDLGSGSEIDVSEGRVELTGPMSYSMTSPDQFEWADGATLVMLGDNLEPCQGLELAGKDYGDDPLGFEDNFQLDHLVIGPGAQINLVDYIDNGSVGGAGGCQEALYVETLEFADENSRLLTNGLHIYYNTLIGDPSQIITEVNCVFSDPPTCDGDANGDHTVDPLDSGFVLSRFGCPVGTCILECDAADQNRDGVVDPLDAGFVLSRFGVCP